MLYEIPEGPVRGPSADDRWEYANGGLTAVGTAFPAGVVLAAPGSRVHSSTFTGFVESIEPVHPTAAVTLTGTPVTYRRSSNGFGRRPTTAKLNRTSRWNWANWRSSPAVCSRTTTGAKPVSSRRNRQRWPHLYVLNADGSVREDDYVAVGGGAKLAYGALESAYSDERDSPQVTTAVTDALRSAVARDPGSIGMGYLAKISSEGVDISELELLGE